MSPPAERQKSVSFKAAKNCDARCTAQPFTTPLGSRRWRPSAVGRLIENAPSDSSSATAPSWSTSATSGWALLDHELSTVQAADDRIIAIRAEDRVHSAQLVDHGFPRLISGGAGSRA